MRQDHKYKDQDLFNDKERHTHKHKENTGNDDSNGIEKLTSSKVKNAHASGMGALERSNESQIEKEDQVDSETDDAVY